MYYVEYCARQRSPGSGVIDNLFLNQLLQSYSTIALVIQTNGYEVISSPLLPVVELRRDRVAQTAIFGNSNLARQAFSGSGSAAQNIFDKSNKTSRFFGSNLVKIGALQSRHLQHDVAITIDRNQMVRKRQVTLSVMSRAFVRCH